MSEKQQMEIDARLLEDIRRIAERQGRSPEAVLEEAVRDYLVFRWDEGAGEGHRTSGDWSWHTSEERSRDGFLSLLDRMSSRFKLDQDEAMRIAVEEQHAFRRERQRKESER
jgi:hypothetical protein